MSVFSKAKKYRKPSRSIDEKVKLLNQDLEKTGVVVESAPANSSTGVYSHTTFENDGDNVPKVIEDVPDPTGFRDTPTGGSADNASDIDPSDSSTWATGGQGMDDLINPNTLPVENGPDLTDQPTVETPDLTGFKPLRSDPENPDSGMNKYSGVARTGLLGVWGTSTGIIGEGNKFHMVLAAFGWPSGPSGSSETLGDDYPSDRSYGGFYRNDDDATYAARLNMKAMVNNIPEGGKWVPYKCWMPFNSYGFSQTWTQYTSNPDNIWREDGYAYVTVSVYAGPGKYNSQEPGKPQTTVVFQGGLGDPNYYPGNPKDDDDFGDFWDWWQENEDLSDEAVDKAKDEAEEQQEKLDDILDKIKNGEPLTEEEEQWLRDNGFGDLADEYGGDGNAAGDWISELVGLGLTYGIIKLLLGAGLGWLLRKFLKGKATYDDIMDAVEKIGGKADDVDDMLEKLQDLMRRFEKEFGFNGWEAMDALRKLGKQGLARRISDAMDDFESGVNNAKIIRDLMKQAKKVLDGAKAVEPDVIKDFAEISKKLQKIFKGLKNAAGRSEFKDDASGLQQMYNSYQAAVKAGKSTSSYLRQIKSLIKKMSNPSNYTGLYNSYEPEGEFITEGDPALGWASPKHTDVDKDEKKRWFKQKDIQPEYPKKKPPKMVHDRHPDLLKGPKKDAPKTKDLIQLSDTDLLRNYKVKPDQIKKCRRIITRLNSYITRNPGILIHLRERYPKDDPRLSKLNYKLDMQNEASDEYMSKHFPENEKLFNRVVKATQRSITLTDPKTYKDKKGKMTSYKKLLRVDYVLNEYDPKDSELKIKKIKSDKKSIGRFFRKPKKKTKGDILKDKMAVLDKEMKKTMPDW